MSDLLYTSHLETSENACSDASYFDASPTTLTPPSPSSSTPPPPSSTTPASTPSSTATASSTPSSSATASSGSTTNGVRVILRIRKRFPDESVEPAVLHAGGGAIELITDPSAPKPSRAARTLFHFDGFYGEDAGQEALFAEARQMLGNVTRGINVTMMAYGATGSGKTYTMQGAEGAEGIIPRSVAALLQLKAAAADMGVQVSYLEIYNDRVYDLLTPGSKELAVRQGADGSVYVASATEQAVESMEDFRRAYESGVKHRTTGPTALNHYSSRSHALLTLHVRNRVGERTYSAKLCLIDLAGSEDNRRTGNTGERLTESGAINSSLFVLGKCVAAINAGSRRVPYRDSKLTRLLQDALGGSTQALMVVAISPGCNHWAGTYQTLNFAAKSKRIVNVPAVHVVVAAEKKQQEARRVQEIAEQARQKRRLKSMRTITQPHKPSPSLISPSLVSPRTPIHVQIPTAGQRRALGELPRQQRQQAAEGQKELLLFKALEHNKENLPQTPNHKMLRVCTPLSDAQPLTPLSDAQPVTPLSNVQPLTPLSGAQPRRSARRPLLKRDMAELVGGLCLDDSGLRDDDDEEAADDEEADVTFVPSPEERARAKAKRQRIAQPCPELVGGDMEQELLCYLNQQPLKDLQNLHCIGKKRAELILACRPFDALTNLTKIGLKKASLNDFIERNSASLKLHKTS